MRQALRTILRVADGWVCFSGGLAGTNAAGMPAPKTAAEIIKTTCMRVIFDLR